MSAILLCRDCKHFADGSCRHEQNMRQDYVNGGLATRNSADFLRADPSKCGPHARWFEPKDGA